MRGRDGGLLTCAYSAILQQAPPQPKKRTETPRWTAEEAWTQGRSTRRGGHTKHILAKNEPDTESKEMPLSSIPPKGRPGKNLFSSSSSAIAAQQPEDAVAPVRKRRRVPQDD